MTTIFANARILDGTGAKPYAGDVVVDGNTIVDVLPTGQRRPLANANTVDCAGATLMPGLIEPHAHLSFVDQSSPHAFSSLPVEEHLLLSLKHAKLYLDQGFTAAFSAAATKPRLDVVVRNAIHSGDFPGRDCSRRACN